MYSKYMYFLHISAYMHHTCSSYAYNLQPKPKWPYNPPKAPGLRPLRSSLRFGSIVKLHQQASLLLRDGFRDTWGAVGGTSQTPNQRFMKEFLSSGGLGIPGVCSKGMLEFS